MDNEFSGLLLEEGTTNGWRFEDAATTSNKHLDC